MKHKITDISEPINDLESQKAKDAKDFSRTIIKLVASTACAVLGPTIQLAAAASSNSSFIVSTLSTLTLCICAGVINPKLINHLHELYNRKEAISYVEGALNGIQASETVNENEVSGGMTR